MPSYQVNNKHVKNYHGTNTIATPLSMELRCDHFVEFHAMILWSKNAMACVQMNPTSNDPWGASTSKISPTKPVCCWSSSGSVTSLSSLHSGSFPGSRCLFFPINEQHMALNIIWELAFTSEVLRLVSFGTKTVHYLLLPTILKHGHGYLFPRKPTILIFLTHLARRSFLWSSNQSNTFTVKIISHSQRK